MRATGPAVSGFHGLAFVRDDGRCASGRDGVLAFARVEGAIGSDAGDLLIGWDLVEQFG